MCPSRSKDLGVYGITGNLAVLRHVNGDGPCAKMSNFNTLPKSQFSKSLDFKFVVMGDCVQRYTNPAKFGWELGISSAVALPHDGNIQG